MDLSPAKLRAIVNLLADPLQAHAAAHLLSEAAKERHLLVSDLIQMAMAPPSAVTKSIEAGAAASADGGIAAVGRRIDRDHYGLRAFVAAETEKAWLVDGPGGEQTWLPKSQCEHHGEDAAGRAILIVPMWLARRKEWPWAS